MASIGEGMSASVDFNISSFTKMAGMIPSLNGVFLGVIGRDARTTLKEKYLSGQEITLRAFPKDRAGRHTIVSQMDKGKTMVRIYSYPVNFFETGRKLRDGRLESGKYIITKKLKSDVFGKMSMYQAKFERIMQNEINARTK